MTRSLIVARQPSRRKLKPPVLSRLSIAWASLAVCLVGGYAGLAATDLGGASRYELDIDNVEALARPDRSWDASGHRVQALRQPEPEERLDAPIAAAVDYAEPPYPAPGATRPTFAAGEVVFPEDEYAAEEELPGRNAPDLVRQGPRIIRIAGAASDDRQGAGWTVRTPPAGEHADEDAPGEIQITIDGAPARARGEAAPNRDASGRLAKPIPDPFEHLQRESPFGFAPAVGPDGLTPSRAYAHAFNPADTPHVAMIVAGLGLDPAVTARAIDELPPAVSLSFAPYAKDLPYWTARAREAGHEILIELPMEQGARNETEIGPAGLTTVRAAADNIRRLEWLLSRFGGYVGATNYLGAKFASDGAALHPVLSRLRSAGLVFFDDTGQVRRFGAPTARDVAGVSRLITPASGAPGSILAELETIAERDGVALGKAYLSAETFDPVLAWARTLEERDLTLAPASAVFDLAKGRNG